MCTPVVLTDGTGTTDVSDSRWKAPMLLLNFFVNTIAMQVTSKWQDMHKLYSISAKPL